MRGRKPGAATLRFPTRRRHSGYWRGPDRSTSTRPLCPANRDHGPIRVPRSARYSTSRTMKVKSVAVPSMAVVVSTAKYRFEPSPIRNGISTLMSPTRSSSSEKTRARPPSARTGSAALIGPVIATMKRTNDRMVRIIVPIHRLFAGSGSGRIPPAGRSAPPP